MWRMGIGSTAVAACSWVVHLRGAQQMDAQHGIIELIVNFAMLRRLSSVLLLSVAFVFVAEPAPVVLITQHSVPLVASSILQLT